MTFGALLRMARAWVGETEGRTPAALEAMIAQGQSATSEVPEERRADWQRLLAVLEKTEDGDARTTARVEGLVRACPLFRGKKRSAAQRAARAARPPPAAVRAQPFDSVDCL